MLSANAGARRSYSITDSALLFASLSNIFSDMMVTLPSSTVGAKFLGSRDKIGVAGTISTNTTEVRVLGLESGVDSNDFGYTTCGTVSLPGICTAVELCTLAIS